MRSLGDESKTQREEDSGGRSNQSFYFSKTSNDDQYVRSVCSRMHVTVGAEIDHSQNRIAAS